MGIVSLNITEDTAKILSDILLIFVGNWIPVVIFTLCLSFIAVLVFLCTTQLPRLFSSVVAFIDTATVSFPVITKSINDLTLNVEKMNTALAPLLNIHSRMDTLRTFIGEEFDTVKHSIERLGRRLP
jgi:hypothetical protein